jgi:hypothetical protein
MLCIDSYIRLKYDVPKFPSITPLFLLNTHRAAMYDTADPRIPHRHLHYYLKAKSDRLAPDTVFYNSKIIYLGLRSRSSAHLL